MEVDFELLNISFNSSGFCFGILGFNGNYLLAIGVGKHYRAISLFWQSKKF